MELVFASLFVAILLKFFFVYAWHTVNGKWEVVIQVY